MYEKTDFSMPEYVAINGGLIQINQDLSIKQFIEMYKCYDSHIYSEASKPIVEAILNKLNWNWYTIWFK